MVALRIFPVYSTEFYGLIRCIVLWLPIRRDAGRTAANIVDFQEKGAGYVTQQLHVSIARLLKFFLDHFLLEEWEIAHLSACNY
jgi:hypothetical protein